AAMPLLNPLGLSQPGGCRIFMGPLSIVVKLEGQNSAKDELKNIPNCLPPKNAIGICVPYSTLGRHYALCFRYYAN
ncbi:MAG: hypothetical protein NZ936_04715, partial [Alphaproteobacteria bacterium]|nr:hypothetical protein [Alphaproteobacteria bacterium]